MKSAVARWDERIARARELADRYPAAAEILTFYARLAEYQKSVAARWAAAGTALSSTDSLVESEDAERVLGAVADFLVWLRDTAPQRLRDAVAEMRRLDRSEWRALLQEYLTRRDSGTAPAHAPRVFVIEALLQPLVEPLAARRFLSGRLKPAPTIRGASRCPFCDGLPVVGVLREEGEGAKRSLVCGLCLTEWSYLRLVCPSCGEQQFDALPVFTSEQIPAARIDACDACRRYLKTIDLTRDGLAIPVVDDLATVTLDLWAREQGYARLRSNLLGT